MVQAAVSGAVDFSKGDPRDKKWLLRLRLVLDELENRKLRAAAELGYARYLALSSRSDLTSEGVSAILDSVDTQYRRILAQLFPWQDVDQGSQQKAATDRLEAQWRQRYGDPESPETQARIAATVAKLEAMRVAPPQNARRRP